MSRGGKRPNAGRRPLLDAWQRLEVGIDCEAEYNRLATEALNVLVDERIGRSDYRATIASINRVPVSLRANFIQSEAFEGHQFDVEQERHAIAGTDPESGMSAPCVLQVISKRPYGVRPKIIADVASKWGISESLVRKCWDEARATRREIENT